MTLLRILFLGIFIGWIIHPVRKIKYKDVQFVIETFDTSRREIKWDSIMKVVKERDVRNRDSFMIDSIKFFIKIIDTSEWKFDKIIILDEGWNPQLANLNH